MLSANIIEELKTIKARFQYSPEPLNEQHDEYINRLNRLALSQHHLSQGIPRFKIDVYSVEDFKEEYWAAFSEQRNPINDAAAQISNPDSYFADIANLLGHPIDEQDLMINNHGAIRLSAENDLAEFIDLILENEEAQE
ncbi:hypothetical protein ACYATM_01055 [Lactobacillaceae bacterium Scapto_B20]